jgi:hypothetical protein
MILSFYDGGLRFFKLVVYIVVISFVDISYYFV